MMFTVPMKLLSAAVLTKDANAVSDELLRIGMLDSVSVKDLHGAQGALEREADTRVDQIREARRRVEGFLLLADPPVKRPDLADFVGKDAPDLGEAAKKLDMVAANVNGIRERQKEIQEQILKLDEIKRQLDASRGNAKAFSGSSFLTVRNGSVPETSWPSLEKTLSQFPIVAAPGQQARDGRRQLMVVMLKRDDARILAILQKNLWAEAAEGEGRGADSGETQRDLEARRTKLMALLDECAAGFRNIFEKQGEELGMLWAGLRSAELSSRVRASFSRTDSVSLFSGWIPAEHRDRVESGIRAASGGRCFIEWLDADQAESQGFEPPVAMRNPTILQPFQTLVTNFGVPKYGTVDPTPFVAVSYLSMFGLMFGDAGHGLVLVLAGLFWYLRSKRAGKDLTLGKLIMYCGGAAIVSGLLFGSIFGFALLPPLWFPYHLIVNGEAVARGGIRTLSDILAITIKFGMVVMGTGFVINWVNLFRKKEWITLLFDKAGIVGGWIYAAGAWAAFYFAGHQYKELPPANLLFWFLAVPTVLLAVKAPLEFFETMRHEPGSGREGHAGHTSQGKAPSAASAVMGFVMEWIVNILEVYSGYLANTLSFMRVAGLGIAHVSLMTAFFQIARMASPQGGTTLLGILILVLGNVLVIALEGLSAGIQSLRLNYYEFFSKYFNGTGRVYSPISLRSKD